MTALPRATTSARRRIAIGMLAVASLALPLGVALAEQLPTALPADGRIKQFVYNEHTVYRLDTHTNFVSTVQFGPGETVESIQVGDSASWQIVRLKRGDVISIKPLNGDAATNMTVYTDRRVYSFELRARRGRPGAHTRQNYRTTFAYPTPVIDEFAGSGRAIRNHDYHVAGDHAFAPVTVYDDGQQTFFRLPEGVERPALFRVGPRGREELVNVHSAGDVLIADGTSAQWTLRLDDEAVCVADGTVARRSVRRPSRVARLAPDSGR